MEQTLLDGLRAMNARQCRPPLTDEEVQSVFRSAIKYRREDAATDAIFPGVEAVVEGPQTVYRPAGLELTIHAGDPTMFELRCEEFRPYNSTGAVRVPAEVWADSRKMKTAMIGAFPGVPFDRHPGDFARIWDGVAPQPVTRTRGAREAVTGLRVLLEQEATAAGRRVEVTDPAEHGTRRLVSFLVELFDRWGESGPAPCETRGEDVDENEIIIERCGRYGGWVYGKMVFVWHEAWAQIERIHRTDRGDGAKLSAAVREIIGKPLETHRVQFKRTRRWYKFLTVHEIELLRAYCTGGTGGTGAIGDSYGRCAGAPEPEKGVARGARGDENAV